MYGYIYLTTNLINGKKYIGQKKSDKFLGTKYLGSGKILKQAIDKDGKDNFSVQMLCECFSKEDLDNKEIYYIAKYNAQTDRNFYNICKGGESGPGGPKFKGHHHNDKTKQLMRSSRKGCLNSNYGNRWSQSAELRQLHSKLSKGSNNGMYGKHHTQEAKSKISAKNRDSMKDRIGINNGTTNRYVKNFELSNYLLNGWKLGIMQSDEQRLKCSQTGKLTSLRKWITDGVNTKYVYKTDLDQYLNNGWKLGRTFNKKINNK